MSTSTFPRPGTPFPFTHPDPMSTYRRPSQPLHFALPALPARTPPSLLKRSGSSSVGTATLSKVPRYASSSPRLPATPTLGASKERRESTSSCASSSSSQSSSSPVLSTPVLHPIDEPSMDLEILLDSPSEAISPFMLGYTLGKTPSSTPSPTVVRPKLRRGEAVPLPPAAPTYTRPKLTRRDTPRPSLELEEMRMEGMESTDRLGRGKQRSYTSHVDGGKWVVVA